MEQECWTKKADLVQNCFYITFYRIELQPLPKSVFIPSLFIHPHLTDLPLMQWVSLFLLGPELWPGELGPVARVQAGGEELPVGG